MRNISQWTGKFRIDDYPVGYHEEHMTQVNVDQSLKGGPAQYGYWGASRPDEGERENARIEHPSRERQHYDRLRVMEGCCPVYPLVNPGTVNI